MKILFVVQRLPPDVDPEAICSAKLINAVVAAGADVTVITGTRNPEVNAAAVRVVPFRLHESAGERLLRIVNRYPELGWAWAKRVAREIRRELARESVQVVCTRAMPFISHVAALRADLPASVVWAAHFSDPWPADDFWKDRSGRRLKWHRRVARAADLITFPCRRVAEYAAIHQWDGCRPRNAFALVPHMSNSVIPGVTRSDGRRRVEFLHCGNFYGSRQPDTLLDGWKLWLERNPSEADRVILSQVGAKSAEFQRIVESKGISDTTHQAGQVAYCESLQRMRNADFLVLVENANSSEGIYLPSKLIDYLSCRRPVIALSAADGTVSDLLGEQYPLRVDPASPEAVAMCLERISQAGYTVDSATDAHLATLAESFTPDAIAKAFLSELERWVVRKQSSSPQARQVPDETGAEAYRTTDAGDD